MNSDWFLPHIIQYRLAGGVVPYAYVGASPATQAFFESRIAWVDQLTGLRFYRSASPLLQIIQRPVIPGGRDGYASSDNGGLQVYITSDPTTDRARFVAIHELGHVLGLNHPFDDGMSYQAPNRLTIMSGRKPWSDAYRSMFSPLDIRHLQQAHGPGDAITGTAAAEELLGTTGPDVLIGRAGDDYIRPRRGADYIRPGAGVDTIVLNRPTDPTSWDLIEGFAAEDRLELRGMDPGAVSYRRDLSDVWLDWNGLPVAQLMNATFMRKDNFREWLY